MQVSVIVFGQLADITNGSVSVKNVTDTNGLVKELHQLYPALAGIKYMIAVNKQVINENTILNDNSVVALLPPFSGG